MGNVHEVCKKALLLHCGGQELQDGFSTETFDEQFVAVDDVRPTVSDGLSTILKNKIKKRIVNAPLPICLSSNVSTV